MTYDANWLDTCSFAAGIANVVFQGLRRAVRWHGQRALFAFMNGLAVPPMVLLVLATFASGLLAYLTTASRPTLCVAGIAGLLALLDLQGPWFPTHRRRDTNVGSLDPG